jgi:hypothetical protein
MSAPLWSAPSAHSSSGDVTIIAPCPPARHRATSPFRRNRRPIRTGSPLRVTTETSLTVPRSPMTTRASASRRDGSSPGSTSGSAAGPLERQLWLGLYWKLDQLAWRGEPAWNAIATPVMPFRTGTAGHRCVRRPDRAALLLLASAGAMRVAAEAPGSASANPDPLSSSVFETRGPCGRRHGWWTGRGRMRAATHGLLRSIPRDWRHDQQTHPWRAGSPCGASPSRRTHRGHRGSPRRCSSDAIAPPAVGPRSAPRPLARLKALWPRLGRGAIPGRA